ncbi:hypothetical protein KP79_PYT21343 [Mizuhopecten yessoensis]|uniref:G-protein coupled receptors family 1 profile domain-containing protein n=1 Tax=Mizuhopecten yessoensis TaxID=6573 RepID=A0A210PKX3_MIZYE|nr:hypothetical protein KP79_PYT21343 [Mizuhopecten yessoensis]
MDILKGMTLITYIHIDVSRHCIVQDHFLYVLHVSTIIQLAFMGPDRVIHIYRPRFYQKFFTKRSILALCIVTWGVALVLSAFGCIFKGNYQRCHISTESDQIQIAAPLASVLVASVLVSTVSGFLLFYKVWSLKQHTTGNRGEVRSYKGHIVIAIMQICILALATPCAVCLILLSFDKEARMVMEFPIKETIRISAACFTMSGILIPPVYVLRLTECRIRFLEILCFWHPFLKQKAIMMDIKFRMDMVGIPITRGGQISTSRGERY